MLIHIYFLGLRVFWETRFSLPTATGSVFLNTRSSGNNTRVLGLVLPLHTN
jgi:hypothetical protein